jgi:hypothetical protein
VRYHCNPFEISINSVLTLPAVRHNFRYYYRDRKEKCVFNNIFFKKILFLIIYFFNEILLHTFLSCHGNNTENYAARREGLIPNLWIFQRGYSGISPIPLHQRSGLSPNGLAINAMHVSVSRDNIIFSKLSE